MSIFFRHATESDAEAVHNLIQAAFAEYIDTIVVPPGALSDTLEYTREAISEGRTVLAFLGDLDWTDGDFDYSQAALAGTARYEPRDNYLYVGRVAVHPDYRRHGIGKALMEYIERIASTSGYTRLYLETRASMPGNLAFYERLGYAIVKEEDHPRGPDINVGFEKPISRSISYEMLDVPIVARYSGSEISIEGVSSALLQFASMLNLRLGHLDCIPLVPDGPASPYDGYLQIIYVQRTYRLVKIDRAGDILNISGSGANLQILSENVSFVATQVANDLASGTHLHVEYYPDHPFLDPTAIPLIIECLADTKDIPNEGSVHS
jgi:ribosomal protein S18 acetylase RimI-like enzyme